MYVLASTSVVCPWVQKLNLEPENRAQYGLKLFTFFLGGNDAKNSESNPCRIVKNEPRCTGRFFPWFAVLFSLEKRNQRSDSRSAVLPDSRTFYLPRVEDFTWQTDDCTSAGLKIGMMFQ